MAFELISAAFTEGGDIPTEHTCDGADRPIPLAWTGTPAGTAEFALVMDDPDARGFVHWVVTGIPAEALGTDGDALPPGVREGRNGYGRVGYGGPCPPSGTHRYQFTLYALSEPLNLTGVPAADGLRRAAASMTLGEARLTGKYARQR